MPIKEIPWNQLRDEVFQTAKDHGWHDRRRELYETLALIHSEASEAVEEMRKGSPAVYEKDGKLEGTAIEIVDVIIRILDWAGEQEVDVIPVSPKNGIAHMETLEVIMRVHEQISRCWTWRHDEDASQECLMLALGYCVALLQFNGENVESLIRAKNEINKRRERKHGKAF